MGEGRGRGQAAGSGDGRRERQTVQGAGRRGPGGARARPLLLRVPSTPLVSTRVRDRRLVLHPHLRPAQGGASGPLPRTCPFPLVLTSSFLFFFPPHFAPGILPFPALFLLGPELQGASWASLDLHCWCPEWASMETASETRVLDPRAPC